jgi:hypothetical protein
MYILPIRPSSISATMDSLTVSILDLPDEILLIIFKKLDLLYSLIGC